VHDSASQHRVLDFRQIWMWMTPNTRFSSKCHFRASRLTNVTTYIVALGTHHVWLN